MRIETIAHVNALLPAFNENTPLFDFILVIQVLRSKEGSELFKTISTERDRSEELRRIKEELKKTNDTGSSMLIANKFIRIAHLINKGDIILKD